jgi:plasmid stabilization system protein ParE
MEVSYHPKVPGEVRSFLDHYDRISGKLGDAFWAELTEVIEQARRHPERHHFDPTGRRRANLKRFPVHVLFRILPTTIRITAVRHDKQHPSHGARRQ